ncbi:hypothetical protein Hte_008376 [Hypoxylon texense]
MPAPYPDVQTAVVQDAAGLPIIVHDATYPMIRPGTVLVKTAAVALIPSDYKMGKKFPSPGARVGMDFAGRVIGFDNTTRPDLKIGDRVCGIVHGSNPADLDSGSFARYVLARSELLLRVPDHWSMEEAATLGSTLFTNCLALWSALRIVHTPEDPAEERTPVLVYGGSTTCGTMAIQLLSLSGFDPIVTCSARHFDLVRSYGAVAVFDHMSSEVGASIRSSTRGKIRCALDCITSQESAACCCAAIGRPGGRYACLEAFEPDWITRGAVRGEFVMGLEALGDDIKLGGAYGRPPCREKHELAIRFTSMAQRLLDGGKLRAHPVEVIGQSFEAILEGLRLLRSGSVSGKRLVVLLE